MSSTRQLRTQMKSLKSLQKILKALEIVSTIKLQKLKKKTESLREFFIDFLNILQAVEGDINLFDFDKESRDENGRRLVIMVSTDKWLCGPITSKLTKHIATKYESIKDKVDVFVVGKKWLEFFVRDNWNIVGSLQLKDDFSENELLPLFTYIKDSIAQKKYAKIKVYFNFFKNTMTQIPLRFKLFPLDKDSFDMFLQDIDLKLEKIEKPKSDTLLLEPTVQLLKQKLIEESIKYIAYSAVIQNKTGEHAARMIAMKNAKENSGDIIRSVNIRYNKVRQSKITQEISEIWNAKAAIEQAQQ